MAINTDINNTVINQLISKYSQAELIMLEKIKKQLLNNLKPSLSYTRKLAQIQKAKKELDILIKSLEKEAKETGSKLIIEAYEKGQLSAEADFGLTKTLRGTIPAKVSNLVLEYNDIITNSILRTTRYIDDIFRDMQVDAAQNVLLGVETRKQAAKKLLNNLANKGITGFVDKAGRRWDLLSYSEMATRTVTARSALNGHLDRQQQANRDLVLISAHGGCPLCQPYEGLVYSLSGTSLKYPSFQTAINGGIFHPNCVHTVTGYIEGLTRIPEVQRTPEQYKYQETQRYNERQIRKWKKREAISVDKKDEIKAQSKIKEWQGKNRELLKEYKNKYNVTLRRKYNRESINSTR